MVPSSLPQLARAPGEQSTYNLRASRAHSPSPQSPSCVASPSLESPPRGAAAAAPPPPKRRRAPRSKKAAGGPLSPESKARHEAMQLVRSGGGQRPPDFVVKLFLMFQEFPELIAWDSGKIVIPAPATKLGSVLSKFFRTGKFTSFQRQLNNFGFHKKVSESTSSARVYARADMDGFPAEALLSLRRKPGCAFATWDPPASGPPPRVEPGAAAALGGAPPFGEIDDGASDHSPAPPPLFGGELGDGAFDGRMDYAAVEAELELCQLRNELDVEVAALPDAPFARGADEAADGFDALLAHLGDGRDDGAAAPPRPEHRGADDLPGLWLPVGALS